MANALNKAQAKAQKKKIIILAVMVLGAGATWSKALFAKDEKPKAPTASANTNSGTPAASTGRSSAPAATTAASSINSYEKAVQRMALWPKALDRKVHVGTIEELTPINDLLTVDGDLEFPAEPEIQEETTAHLNTEIPPVVEESNIAFDALRLRLTTTARLGKTSYAVINNTRVKLGDSVEVQVDGESVRYEVRAIETRMVEVVFQGTSHILRIDLPELQHRDTDGD